MRNTAKIKNQMWLQRIFFENYQELVGVHNHKQGFNLLKMGMDQIGVAYSAYAK